MRMENLCVGGAAHGVIVSRYSKRNGFNNSSVHCEAWKSFYSHVAASLLNIGMSYAALQASLVHDDETWPTYQEPCAFSTAGVFAEAPAQRLQVVTFHNHTQSDMNAELSNG